MDHNTCPSCGQTPNKTRRACADHFSGYRTNNGKLAVPCSGICAANRHPTVDTVTLYNWAKQSRQ